MKIAQVKYAIQSNQFINQDVYHISSKYTHLFLICRTHLYNYLYSFINKKDRVLLRFLTNDVIAFCTSNIDSSEYWQTIWIMSFDFFLFTFIQLNTSQTTKVIISRRHKYILMFSNLIVGIALLCLTFYSVLSDMPQGIDGPQVVHIFFFA